MFFFALPTSGKKRTLKWWVKRRGVIHEGSIISLVLVKKKIIDLEAQGRGKRGCIEKGRRLAPSTLRLTREWLTVRRMLMRLRRGGGDGGQVEIGRLVGHSGGGPPGYVFARVGE